MSSSTLPRLGVATVGLAFQLHYLGIFVLALVTSLIVAYWGIRKKEKAKCN